MLGATVTGSVLFPGAVVNAGASVERSVLMHNAVIGEGAVVLQRHPRQGRGSATGASLGVDPDADRERFRMSGNGVVVVGKGEKIPA